MEYIIEAIRKKLKNIKVETTDNIYTQFLISTEKTEKDVTREDIAEIIKKSGINFIPPTDEKAGSLWFKDGRIMLITVFNLSGSNNNWILMSFI